MISCGGGVDSASSLNVIGLLMGRFRGAVFHHGGVAENSPLALVGRFPPCLMGRFASSRSPGKQPMTTREGPLRGS